MHANLHLNAISRSHGRNAVAASAYRSGRSVVAAAAYRAGERLKDHRHAKTHDYTNKHHVLHAEIISPEGAPIWMQDRGRLWNAVEAQEKRKDAQLAKEVILVLPRHLSSDAHIALTRAWTHENIIRRGLVADIALHSPTASDGGRNPHAHILFTLRPVQGDRFGKKQTGYKAGGLDSREVLKSFRFSYQEQLNRISEESDGKNIIFDLRSYKDRGIDRKPQPKIGPKVKALEEQGHLTERGKEVRRARRYNLGRQGLEQYAETYERIGTHYPAQIIPAKQLAICADLAEKYYHYQALREREYWREQYDDHHPR